MNKYKLLLLDLDGTTVASSGSALPSARVVAAVKQAEQYVRVALATGRPRDLAQPVIDALTLTGPSVFNGGAEIIDVVTHDVLHEQLLTVEAIRELIELSNSFGVAIYSDKDEYGAPLQVSESLEQTAKLFIGSVPTADASHLVEVLSAVKQASPHITTSWDEGDVVDIHITHEHATKRYGVERLMNLLGVTKEEVIAIGDGYNDLPMLEAAGFRVAMGNAPDEIKAVADYVAPSVNEDGVADTIERFILGTVK